MSVRLSIIQERYIEMTERAIMQATAFVSQHKLHNTRRVRSAAGYCCSDNLSLGLRSTRLC